MRQTDSVSVLVVDDAADMLEVVQRNLEARGYRVYTTESVEEALGILDTTPIELVITDYKMPRVSGLELVRHVRENFRGTEVIVITGYASIEGAIEAIKTGAEEYLPKPFTDEELLSAVEKALERRKTRLAVRAETSRAALSLHGLLGESKAMRRLFQAIAKAARTNATVLAVGESGTGKELVARAIHYSSSRASAPFVPVNCGGIPEGLIESELFGHLKGSFTGASATRAGFFLTADQGTIFLDEISELPVPMQVKLLRVLQDKKVLMVGCSQPRQVDVRIIAASNKDLQALVRRGQFRQDLYFRLNVLSLEVPPLRERESDVLLLARQFAEKYAAEIGKPVPRFRDAVLEVFRSYGWPGNVRELENVVQRLVIMAEGDQIDVPDLPSVMRFSASRAPRLDRTLAEVEAEHIKGVIAMTRGNKTQAASILGIDRKTLREKLKLLEWSGSRPSAPDGDEA